MTDNEIVKGLKCCLEDKKDCFECPLQNQWDCNLNLCIYTLDLINRQKAEIERLQTEKDNLIKTYKECMTEAIKEFAERLKGKATTPIGTLYGEMIHIDDIDNLVKEMKEENNAKEI